MTLEASFVVTLLLLVASAVGTFYITTHRIKDYTRDKFDELNREVTMLKIELERLKSKDDLQQQVIDQMKEKNDELIPILSNALKQKQNVK